jgi:DNA repair exonuclease SbcCD ATPase subunit
MITFVKLTYRNFLSSGDTPIEIDLHSSLKTLVIGTNGTGKSMMLDALSFALFGKPHRSINKPQLVNSINGKKCEVSVEFIVGSIRYRIHRGIKPNRFEIWADGNKIDQQSHSKDFQKHLEANILKLNHKSFHQIVVLGSSSFVPFMQLSAAHRREVIEDLLDIRVFSQMNTILKEKKASLKNRLQTVSHQEQSLDTQVAMKQNHLKQLEDLQNQNEVTLRKEIEEYDAKIREIEGRMKANQEEMDRYKQPDDSKIVNKKQKLWKFEGNIRNKIDRYKKEIKFFNENEECPTCSQPIDQSFRTGKIESLQESLEQINDGHQKLEAEIDALEKKHQEIKEEISSVQRLEYLIQMSRQEMSLNIQKRDSLYKELNKDSIDLTEHRKELDQLVESYNQNRKLRQEIEEEQTYHLVAEELLKDSGIKTRIIQLYLPVMNQMINEYLSAFDFFVSFTLDESFNETIRSRHRDDFSYESFSEGEKAKIDLALMLTWRRIAQHKNSTHTNLLIMDEVFDGSLDEAGSESLMKIFDSLEGSDNIFVISHKTDVWQDKFDRVLRFHKKNNFSVVEEIN